ncbi:DUF1834 family protein [Caulobacter sp. SLTY]|uniref:phage protein Gp37 n=1 Tax=Caulobacter sp. SLTY TaxID=2683262 RepID=UPI0014137595|nr:phage protein Gp37 [Caulobacter sp. SLTY]NBB17551.1 DUF1834 family protein [Caulobacter sp. SLTY]
MIAGQVENAVIEHLEAASAANVLGYVLKEVDSLPTDVDANFAAYIRKMPAAWTVWTGWRMLDDLGDGETKVELRFNLVVGASSQRNERAQRHGVEGEVGAYQLALDLPSLIMGQTFGLPISEISIGDCSSLFSPGTQAQLKASLFGIAFSCQAELARFAPYPLVNPAVGRFETFSIGWDIPPHLGEADLGQTITLEQDD